MDRYLLAITPPENVCATVDEYRRTYARRARYSIVPHITIYPPFLLREEITEANLVRDLQARLANQSPGSVTTDAIGYFRGKNNVTYFKPDTPSEKFLKGLILAVHEVIDGKILHAYPDYKLEPERFVPHMTIAERLTEEELEVAEKELAHFNEKLSFAVPAVDLYKYADAAKEWQRAERIFLRDGIQTAPAVEVWPGR